MFWFAGFWIVNFGFETVWVVLMIYGLICTFALQVFFVKIVRNCSFWFGYRPMNLSLKIGLLLCVLCLGLYSAGF